MLQSRTTLQACVGMNQTCVASERLRLKPADSRELSWAAGTVTARTWAPIPAVATLSL